jgi:uncharacterized protein (TIGR00730 family)
LGLRYTATPSYETAEAVWSARRPKSEHLVFSKVEKPKDPTFEIHLDQLTYGQMKTLINHAEVMRAGEENMQGTHGAVIFGSSQADEPYVKKVSEVSRYLAEQGLPVVTGGAGGFMKVANEAAFQAGGESVGIYIGGRGTLSSESVIPKDVHTKSLEVSDYAERIPLLLNGRDLIVFVPGKAGTMRELASVMLKSAHDPHSKAPIIFVDAHYYGEVVRWLRAAPVPKSFKDRLHLVHDVAGFKTLFATLKETGSEFK